MTPTELLDNLHIKYRVVQHAPVFTVAESQSVMKEKIPTKCLLLADKMDKKFLVIVDGNARLNLKELARQIGSGRLSFADKQTLMDLFGVEPGAVSIFGLLRCDADAVTVIVDKTMMSLNKEICFHPNDNTQSIFFLSENITKILDKLDVKYEIIEVAK